MTYLVITRGAHWKEPDARALVAERLAAEGRCILAHYLDPDEVEDRAHQVANFVTYATALGFTSPVALITPLGCPESLAAEWIENVVSSLHCAVIRP